MNNEAGFFLPYVLFITTLIFIIITANINTYQKEILISKMHSDQIQFETLFQMGHVAFKKEAQILEENTGKLDYNFPTGAVHITYRAVSKDKYRLLFTIYTSDNAVYSMKTWVTIENATK